MKKRNRVFAIMLALVMAMTYMPALAFAEGEEAAADTPAAAAEQNEEPAEASERDGEPAADVPAEAQSEEAAAEQDDADQAEAVGGGEESTSLDKLMAGEAGNLSWNLDASGVFTISGSGPMGNYKENCPWYDQKEKIKKVVIKDGITSVGDYAFDYCEGVTSVTIPDSVTRIGARAFLACSMKEITIPAGVTEIGSNAFADCEELTAAYFKGDAAKWCGIKFGVMGSNPCINGCKLYCNGKEVTSVTIPKGTTSIGDCTFLGVKSLTSVTIPEGVTSIGCSAFEGTSLTKVTLPDGMKTLGLSAFNNCGSLTSVSIPKSLEACDAFAFDECGNLKDVYYRGECKDWLGIKFEAYSSNPCTGGRNLYFNGTKVTEVTIPGGSESIGDNAFVGCTSLTKVSIPAGVKSIGVSAFRECSNLTKADIPAGLTKIGDFAFDSCGKLSGITLPESVTEIGDGAFDSCTGLTSIVIPKYVTSLGDGAFAKCKGLKSITIPAGLTSIGEDAFVECMGMEDIYYGGTMSQWKALEHRPEYGTAHCSDGEVKGKEPEIDSDECDHYITSVSKPATCQEAGIKKHYECTICHEKFSDAYGTKALTAKQIKKLMIAKKKHSYKEKKLDAEHLKSAATCTKPAVYYYSCKMCHEKGKKTFKSGKKLGHDFVPGSIKKATGKKDGKIASKCSRCGKTNKGVKIPKASKVISLNKKSIKYIGEGKEKDSISLKIKAGKYPVSSDEYTVTYGEPVYKGKKSKGTVTVTFKPDCKYYSGSMTLTYKITKAPKK